MTDVRRIAVATFGRSDFSILRPLCQQLALESDFDVGWWVGGAHFDAPSGRSVAEIEAVGIPIWARIDCGVYDRSELGTVDMMAQQMTGFASAAAASPEPDLVLILGDRFEAVAAGLAMVPLGVPVGHISGGSITEGAIDDVFRHCLTQIAIVHFCDLPEFARRIQHMGEPPEHIFTTGALGLDAFVTAPRRPFAELTAAFELTGLEPGYVLATLHPESRLPDATRPMTEALVDALRATGRQVVFTHPNADPGSDTIIEIIESAATGADIHCVSGFGADWFPTAMAHAGLMVGNSSGGIIEAASFDLPVVDIGDRQRGREHGPNVIHCGRERSAIADGIDAATDPAFIALAATGNIYGDGRGRERVTTALRSLDWKHLRDPKRFADPDPNFRGTLMDIA
jgi:UDP-hydrolysing UDP-N-acetyl-D-glucosamine 2-epimerase